MKSHKPLPNEIHVLAYNGWDVYLNPEGSSSFCEEA